MAGVPGAQRRRRRHGYDPSLLSLTGRPAHAIRHHGEHQRGSAAVRAAAVLHLAQRHRVQLRRDGRHPRQQHRIRPPHRSP